MQDSLSCSLLKLTDVCINVPPRPGLTGARRDGVEPPVGLLDAVSPGELSLASMRLGVELGVLHATCDASSFFIGKRDRGLS